MIIATLGSLFLYRFFNAKHNNETVMNGKWRFSFLLMEKINETVMRLGQK